MRQIFEDYFYPLSRVQEYQQSLSVSMLINACLVFSAWAWVFAIPPLDWKRAMACYIVCAISLIALNFRLGVLIGESENPPMS